MEGVWQWGLSVIVWMQSMRSPIADAIFAVGSFLGEEEFFFLLFATLIWAIDARTGFRIAVIFLISVYLNYLAKTVIAHPRPFDLNPSVGLGAQPGLGYGIPSGHAQNAVVIWGGLAAWRRTTWAWIGAVAVIGLIGLSRIYRGVHFPTDVLGGWLLGAVILLVALAYTGRVAATVGRWSVGSQLALAVVGPAILTAVFPGAGSATVMGTLAGACCGMAIALRRLALDSGATPWQCGLRLLLGLALLVVLYIGLKMAFPVGVGSIRLVFRFVRYALLGSWVTLGAPWLFDILRLTRRAGDRPVTAPTRAS